MLFGEIHRPETSLAELLADLVAPDQRSHLDRALAGREAGTGLNGVSRRGRREDGVGFQDGLDPLAQLGVAATLLVEELRPLDRGDPPGRVEDTSLVRQHPFVSLLALPTLRPGYTTVKGPYSRCREHMIGPLSSS